MLKTNVDSNYRQEHTVITSTAEFSDEFSSFNCAVELWVKVDMTKPPG